MASLPATNGKNVIAPHTVILGAGASIAMTRLNAEKFGKELPSMDNLVEKVGLAPLLDKNGIDYYGKNFESLFSEIKEDLSKEEIAQQIEKQIYDYFANMEISDELTIYDYLVMSLSNNDAIATFNWDPFLIQALARCSRFTHNLPRVIHLHGNTGLGVCYDDSVVGHINALCSTCKNPFEPTKLLYPIGKKDYTSDPLIKNEWEILKAYIEESFYITIFGYSAPVSDIEAKTLLLEVWEKNASKGLAQIEIVDIKSKEDLYETWQDFIVRDHYYVSNNIFDSYLFRYPRRSCAAFFEMVGMLRPKKPNPFPKLMTVEELYHWAKPLIDEEESGVKYSFNVLKGETK
ncbi:hypothetical protein MN086_03260 [Sulfurovum sp. XGS-02]|uniref:hypothetical protein n=1 Tax=Sulfurovum sp. XGS-02 TaxID=2925411 RepID=UPI0020495124|nr:hypothetical protein [Sulfurovum sp. XGS-02]UPT78171.1 hypothetical protein MN086_03260 [Sulfurovum sp. XGS-02]